MTTRSTRPSSALPPEKRRTKFLDQKPSKWTRPSSAGARPASAGTRPTSAGTRPSSATSSAGSQFGSRTTEIWSFATQRLLKSTRITLGCHFDGSQWIDSSIQLLDDMVAESDCGSEGSKRRTLMRKKTEKCMAGFDIVDQSSTSATMPYSPRSFEHVKQTLHHGQTEVLDSLEAIANKRLEEKEKMRNSTQEAQEEQEAPGPVKKAGKYQSGSMRMGDSVTIRGHVLDMENLDQCSDANCRVQARIALHKLGNVPGTHEAMLAVPMAEGLVDIRKLCSGNLKKEDIEEKIRGRRSMLARPQSAPNFLARNRSADSLHKNLATVSIANSIRSQRTEAILIRKVQEMEALRWRAFAGSAAYKAGNDKMSQKLEWVKWLTVCSFCGQLTGPLFAGRNMVRRKALTKKFDLVIRVLRFVRNCKRRVKVTRHWEMVFKMMKIWRLLFRKKTIHRFADILKHFLRHLGDAFKIQYGIRQFFWAIRTIQRRWRSFSSRLRKFCEGELAEAWKLAEGSLLSQIIGRIVEDEIMIIQPNKLTMPKQASKRKTMKPRATMVRQNTPYGRTSEVGSPTSSGRNSSREGSPTSPKRSISPSDRFSLDGPKRRPTVSPSKSRASMALEKAMAQPQPVKSVPTSTGPEQRGRPTSAPPGGRPTSAPPGNKKPASAGGSKPKGIKKSKADESLNDLPKHKNPHHLSKTANQGLQKRVDEHRFKNKWMYEILRREVIERLHTYCYTLVRFREVAVGELELAKEWMNFRDYLQGDSAGHRSTAKVRIQEEAAQLKKEFQAKKQEDKTTVSIWKIDHKSMNHLVLAAHASMGVRPKNPAVFEELFGSCPEYLVDSMPRKLPQELSGKSPPYKKLGAGVQTIKTAMVLKAEYKANPEGRVLEARHAHTKMPTHQEGVSHVFKTLEIVKNMMHTRTVEDTFLAAEAFSSVHLGTSRGDSSGEPVFGRLRRHRNVLLCQAPITNIDGMSDSDEVMSDSDE